MWCLHFVTSTLFAATFRNSCVKWRLRYVILRFVAFPFFPIEQSKCIKLTIDTNIQLTLYKALHFPEVPLKIVKIFYVTVIKTSLLLCSKNGMWPKLVLTTHEREWRDHVSSPANVMQNKKRRGTESVATLPPFSPIEGQKWFDQISSQWESQNNRFALTFFGKIQFLPPCIWNLPFMSTASGREGLQLIFQPINFIRVIINPFGLTPQY
jgi:hypothetical protein